MHRSVAREIWESLAPNRGNPSPGPGQGQLLRCRGLRQPYNKHKSNKMKTGQNLEESRQCPETPMQGMRGNRSHKFDDVKDDATFLLENVNIQAVIVEYLIRYVDIVSAIDFVRKFFPKRTNFSMRARENIPKEAGSARDTIIHPGNIIYVIHRLEAQDEKKRVLILEWNGFDDANLTISLLFDNLNLSPSFLNVISPRKSPAFTFLPSPSWTNRIFNSMIKFVR
uniref:Uncharacterized protein n=1 Tax=Romanomermis culicivorax TaxID=13658 RepID=A0A915L3K6_ROMCU